MGRIKLREPVKRRTEVDVVVRPALYALECVHCGKVFEMGQAMWPRDRCQVARLCGILEPAPTGSSNMFSATVCSFECAGQVFAGGWRELEEYEDYVAAGAELLRGEVRITTDVISREELIERWSTAPEQQPVRSIFIVEGD